MDSDRLPELRVANDIRDDADELRRRLEEAGGLFFCRLLGRARLLAGTPLAKVETSYLLTLYVPGYLY
ncbi:MAG: hypothetical protein ABGZ17_01565 [Planctomycetaceae bacterium]